MINLELYRIFYEVAKAGNITKASENLNISQPAVTKHIKNLENALGTTLFIRTKKGVVLNETGKSIFLNVKNALSIIEETEKIVSDYNSLNKGIIKIGISTTLVKKYLLKYIESFHKMYSNIIIDIYTDPTSVLIDKLKSGSIDFIIGKFTDDKDLDLDYFALGKTRYVFVGNKSFSELFGKKIDVKDLMNYPILLQKAPSNSRNTIEKYLKDNNVTIKPKMNIASSNLLVDFISIGYGIGFVTELYVLDEIEKKNLFVIDVKQKPDNIIYGLITLKNNVMTHPCKEFIKYLKENQ